MRDNREADEQQARVTPTSRHRAYWLGIGIATTGAVVATAIALGAGEDTSDVVAGGDAVVAEEGYNPLDVPRAAVERAREIQRETVIGVERGDFGTLRVVARQASEASDSNGGGGDEPVALPAEGVITGVDEGTRREEGYGTASVEELVQDVRLVESLPWAEAQARAGHEERRMMLETGFYEEAFGFSPERLQELEEELAVDWEPTHDAWLVVQGTVDDYLCWHPDVPEADYAEHAAGGWLHSYEYGRYGHDFSFGSNYAYSSIEARNQDDQVLGSLDGAPGNATYILAEGTGGLGENIFFAWPVAAETTAFTLEFQNAMGVEGYAPCEGIGSITTVDEYEDYNTGDLRNLTLSGHFRSMD